MYIGGIKLNFLSISDFTETQIGEIFQLTDHLQTHGGIELLEGKTFALFFPDSSLRTRITFEKGIKQLGGDCLLFPSESLDKREKLEDVIQYMENWVDGVIVRHPDFSKLQELSKHASIPIINAMTSENHPCEILSDLYSIRKIRSNYTELVYTFVGPANNISKSWMEIAKVLNLNFNHVCVKGYELGEETPNYKFHTNLENTLGISDIVLTDSLPQILRTDEYIANYQISLERMNLAKQQAVLNPCPPFFRNEEVSEDVISSDYFVGHHFKKNLLYVQQAVILYCMGITSGTDMLLKLALYR